MRSRFFASALTLASLAACGEDDPALTDATSLTCPAPGALPFRIDTGFERRVRRPAVVPPAGDAR